MAVRKKRQPSNKEPVGKTKSRILLFIANNQRCDYTSIREFLRSNFNIRNQKGIRGHLSGLIDENIIRKEARGKGLSDVYFIENNFSAFKRCFNFLNENHFSLDFLKTQYVKETASSDDFFLYGLLNILKDIFFNFYEVILDDKASSELLNQYSKEINDQKNLESMKRQIENIRNSNIQSIIDDLVSKSPEEFLDFLLSFFKEINLDKKNIIWLLGNFFTNDARKKITNIILSSPSAMDYFLNLKGQNRMIFLTVLFRFFLGEIFVDSSKWPLLKQFNKMKIGEEKYNEALKLIPAILSNSNVINDNPILTILKAYFIIDSLNNNVIENEYSTETLSRILIPEVKK